MNGVSKDTTPCKESPRTVFAPPDGAYFRTRQTAKITGRMKAFHRSGFQNRKPFH
jgi:hypothetical protein